MIKLSNFKGGHTMISSIQLSTGTRVIIPIFPQALGYRHLTYSGGVVGDERNGK